MSSSSSSSRFISFQGEQGAFSDLACRSVFPDLTPLPCHSFDDAFQAVEDGDAECAMIAVDNSIAGRVADVHRLMPRHDLFIVKEHFQPVRQNLMALPGTQLADIQFVHSHVHALPQCSAFLAGLDVEKRVHADTAGAAAEVARMKDPAHGAIASVLAADIYGLDIVQRDVADEEDNVTRFLIFSPEPDVPPVEAVTISSLIFEVRNIPAALYKAIGGFATNGLSLLKLESYVDRQFQVAQFYCEVIGHPETEAFQHAVEELGFYARDVRFLGAYAADEARDVGCDAVL